jgi:hypothetical protein
MAAETLHQHGSFHLASVGGLVAHLDHDHPGFDPGQVTTRTWPGLAIHHQRLHEEQDDSARAQAG